MFKLIKPWQVFTLLLGSGIMSFGMYQIHSLNVITEGGGLGLTLLLNYWLNISPAIANLIFNIFCYVLGWRVMGKKFLLYSGIACLGFSGTYAIFEQFPHLWPEIANMPFKAALLGALFIGVGAGLCVRVGGAPGGDDALSMSISKVTKINIQWIYLISDLVVLVLSATYIPVSKLIYSLLTVIISGQLIGIIQKMNIPYKKAVQG